LGTLPTTQRAAQANDAASATHSTRRNPMSVGTILLIILVLILIGVIPVWPHARSWGYAPGGIVGVILLVVLVLLLMGRL
jgi:hypothetical protein